MKKIAIVGGGPGALFMLMRLLDSGMKSMSITVFESKPAPGSGMPYSSDGANAEHVTNVSGNEIPAIRTSLVDWIKKNEKDLYSRFQYRAQSANGYKVVPRLIFGAYLTSQFELLRLEAEQKGVGLSILSNTRVHDITDFPERSNTVLETDDGRRFEFDTVIICTGHMWPVTLEGKQAGYFDSPYPPSKLQLKINHAVAITGSSLTAIDAIRTLARSNGYFVKDKNGVLQFQASSGSENFKIVMHSKHGLLPAIRFHLEDPHLSKKKLISKDALQQHRSENQGFISLDFIFDQDFKEQVRIKDTEFFNGIKDMNLEDFVGTMMEMREKSDPFQFFKAEYQEAQNSIARKESIHWKEMLAVLSFAMNYPAKYFSAEDMLRLQNVLMPLISVIIAFVPQHSCEELIALHDAGRLELVATGEDGKVDVQPEKGITYSFTDQAGIKQRSGYETYINCIGQRHLSADDFPFKGMLRAGSLSPARLKFLNSTAALELKMNGSKDIESQGDNLSLRVSGFAINDHFQIVDAAGMANERIYIMAVPFIGGFNPDYSGLDFCEEASAAIVKELISDRPIR